MIYVGVFLFLFFPSPPPFIVLLSSLTAGTEIFVKLQKQMSLNTLNDTNGWSLTDSTSFSVCATHAWLLIMELWAQK